MKKLIVFLVILTLSIAAYSQTATVIAENANLRGTPSETGKVVDKVSRDTALEVIKQKGAWYLVQTVDYVGWLHGNTIKLTSPLTLETVVDDTPSAPATSKPTSTTNSEKTTTRTYIRGSRGGCYYINSNGNKTYVDRNLCN